MSSLLMHCFKALIVPTESTNHFVKVPIVLIVSTNHCVLIYKLLWHQQLSLTQDVDPVGEPVVVSRPVGDRKARPGPRDQARVTVPAERECLRPG